MAASLFPPSFWPLPKIELREEWRRINNSILQAFLELQHTRRGGGRGEKRGGEEGETFSHLGEMLHFLITSH